MLFCAANVCAQDKEPYAALNEDETVLTFYYDELKSERNGMDVGPFTNSMPKWSESRSTITKAVFDKSFADCNTLTSTAYWFPYLTNLTEIIGIENLKTDKVTDMSGMFAGSANLTSLDLSGFNTDNVTSMYGMFYHCFNLASLDLSNFNTDNVTSMYFLFDNCSNLMSLDLSGFKTDNVNEMTSMFSGCSNLKSLDLRSFNTDHVTSMYFMFAGCSLLKTIDVGKGWSTASLYTNDNGMFGGCESLVGGAGTTYDANHAGGDYARIDGGPDTPGYFTYKDPAGIESIAKDRKAPSAAYNLSGSKLARPQKGINIIDGRKVIVK